MKLQQTLFRALAQAVDGTVGIGLFGLGLGVVYLAAAAIFVAATGSSPLWVRSQLLDTDLLAALGSLLLGLSGLYIGNRLRKFQEVEAEARAKLALNVELRARAVPTTAGQILEVIMEVHNVSRKTWFVPMAYLFVKSPVGDKQDISIGRDHRNLADYTANLCQLQPDERDQFFAAILFPLASEDNPPAVIVRAEIVGTSERWLGPRQEKMEFVEFMGENDGLRHNYYCIGRCDDPQHKWYGMRTFLCSDGSTIDEAATQRYRYLLDDVMLWSRETVVSLSRMSG